MPYDFDNTWGIVKESSFMPSSFLAKISVFLQVF